MLDSAPARPDRATMGTARAPCHQPLGTAIRPTMRRGRPYIWPGFAMASCRYSLAASSAAASASSRRPVLPRKACVACRRLALPGRGWREPVTNQGRGDRSGCSVEVDRPVAVWQGFDRFERTGVDAGRIGHLPCATPRGGVGLAPQDVDHGVGGGELELQADDAYRGVDSDALIHQLAGAVGTV